MTLISVNVSLPKDLPVGSNTVRSGILKTPVKGMIRVRQLNLEGDGQADLTVHGGPDKAVYAYPSEHYDFWRRELGMELPEWGAFGENLTTEGISEDTISIGDQIGIGTAIFQVTQPRLPCFKLAAKFQREDMVERFLKNRRMGFYLRVLTEGELQGGDGITLREKDPHSVTVRELTDLYVNKHPDPSSMLRILSVQALSDAWRRHFENKFGDG